jgi:hypothetical protein
MRVDIVDRSGASIVDATVAVKNEATNVLVSAKSSGSGTYVFPNLLVGTYTVTVERTGFKKIVQKGVIVESNQIAETKVALAVGEVSAVVEVEAGAELVKTESSELGATFSRRVVGELPVNTLGGDVKELAVFAPGTTTQEGGVLGSGGSVGGLRPRFNGFSIDGVDDNRVDVNGPTQPVIQETVAEFTLLTNQFSAEYGHSAGGQFNGDRKLDIFGPGTSQILGPFNSPSGLNKLILEAHESNEFNETGVPLFVDSVCYRCV